MAQRIPLPLTVSCFSKIHIGFTFRVPAHPGSPGQRAVKRACYFTQYLGGCGSLGRLRLIVIRVGVKTGGQRLMLNILDRVDALLLVDVERLKSTQHRLLVRLPLVLATRRHNHTQL